MRRSLVLLVLACGTAASEKPAQVIDLPDGKPGIGFDDLQYSRRVGSVLAPAGRSGALARVDAKTRKVTTVGGFSKAKDFDGGHDFGVTSVADTGAGFAVTDRTSKEVIVVDDAGKVVARAKLAGDPDYVRYIASSKELWVTEPDAEQIEVFTLSPLKSIAKFEVKGGPESLVIDEAHTRAYSNLWRGITVVIDLKARGVVKIWRNGCGGSRGIDLDPARQLVLVGCSDGKAVALAAADGKQLGSIQPVSGMDIIAYSPAKHHLYLAGATSADSAIVDVSDKGDLKLLGKGPGAAGGHCVTTDDAGHAYVCDPKAGRLIVVDDPY